MATTFNNGRFFDYRAIGLTPGAALYSYGAGTLTPLATYTDQGGGSPNANPVICDVNGGADVWLGSSSYKFRLYTDTIANGGVLIDEWDNISGPLAAADLASTSDVALGDALVGVKSTLAGAQGTTQHETNERQRHINDWLTAVERAAVAAGTQTLALDTAIQAGIDAVSALPGGGELLFSPGVHPFSLVTPKSNVTLRGPRAAILSQIQPATNIRTGFYKAAGSGSVTEFHVRGLTFRGNRIASPANVNNNLFWFDLAAGETVTNVSGIGSRYEDVQNTFWYFSTAAAAGSGQNLKFFYNDAITTAAKRNLAGNAFIVAQDFARFENVPANPGVTPWDYGTVCFRDLDVSHNFGESIRTVADFKRGCSDFVAQGNVTRNCDDCHISVDGSFNGTITGNSGSMAAGYAYAASQNNYIEVQGERIVIANNTFDGGNEVNSGIQITDYHLAQELDGVNPLGRQSVGVQIHGNTVKNVLVNAYRLINAAGSVIGVNYCENVGGHTASIEAPGTTYNGSGAVLNPIGCTISGVSSKNASTTGAYVGGGSGHMIGPNLDEYGQDFFDATSALAFTRVGAASDLNPNPSLQITGAGANNIDLFSADVYPAAAVAPTTPNGAAQALRITDANAGSLVGHYIGALVPAVQNSRLYFRVHVLAGTAPTCGILIQEFTSGGAFLVNGYIDLAPGGAWAEKLKTYRIVSATCGYVKIGLTPAAGSNAPANTGYSDVADFRVSRQAIGAR